MERETSTACPAASDAADLTVYYDGACPLCRAEIGVYRNATGADRLAFVDVSADGTELPPGLDRGTALRRFHVADARGELQSGARAFAHLWIALPRWRWLGRLVALPVVSTIAEVTYRLFLRVRPALQRVARRSAG